MRLAVLEMKRAKLRFGLLTVAVALLIFLVLFLSTLSNALVSSLVGALNGLAADGLVYSDTARNNIAASRLNPSTVQQVAAVPGVSTAGGIGTFTTNAVVGHRPAADAQIVGFTPGKPGAPTGLSSGRLPEASGEAAVDGSGIAVGDIITLQPTGQQLKVVGLMRGAQLNATTTAYVTAQTYADEVTAANPGLPFVPLNAVAFDVAPGQDAASVAAAVQQQVPGTTAYTRAQAVALIPGIDSIGQSFGILVGLTFVIGIVVIGFFFLILTVQKLKAFTLLRAVGASTRSLAATVVWQITGVVLVASAFAAVLTWLAAQGLSTGIPVQLQPMVLISTVLAVLICALGAGLLSVRRIARIDPATAAGSR